MKRRISGALQLGGCDTCALAGALGRGTGLDQSRQSMTKRITEHMRGGGGELCFGT